MTVPSTASGSRRPLNVIAAVGARNGKQKVLHCMRHGVTEMNVYLRKNSWDAPDFKDPLMYDTILTPEGRQGARAAASIAARLRPAPEVLVVSPLTRAIQTAQLAFPHYQGAVHVEPLARERLWHASDIGRSPSDLQRAFQDDSRFSFGHLPDVWWHTNDPSRPREIHLEPEDVFLERINALKQRLLQRSESNLAVVAHWGVLFALTGEDFENCEIKTFTLHESGKVQQLNLVQALFS